MSEKLLLRRNGEETSDGQNKEEIILQPEFVRQFRILFDILDTDKDGYIELDELKRYWDLKKSSPAKDSNNNVELNDDAKSTKPSNNENVVLRLRENDVKNMHPFQLTLNALSEASTGHQFITFQQFYYSVKMALTTLKGQSVKKPKLRPTSYIFAISNRSLVDECGNNLAAPKLNDIASSAVNVHGKGYHSNNNESCGNHHRQATTVSTEVSTKQNTDSENLKGKIEKLEHEKAILVKELFEMKTTQPTTSQQNPS